jgi:predicted amidohydrolase YtcJ
MTRYLVERTFPDGLGLPVTQQGAEAAAAIIAKNAELGVTWIHSYVTPDKKKTYCIYDAPTPEAIRKVATRNGLPVDRISEVRVLDPYFYV